MGEKNRKGTGFDKETQSIIGKHFAALVDHAKEKEGLTALAVYKQIYGDDERANKEDKISSMKNGTGITAYDVMKIQAWKNLSLDWLMLGKGDPPPELRGEEECYSEDDEEEYFPLPPSCLTVRGFLKSLMYLSLARYVRDFKIEAHDHDYFYHDINISFQFYPFQNEFERYDYQCDTVTYLTQGLQKLADPKYKLLELPNDDKDVFTLKTTKYDKILDSIPQDQLLSNYNGGIVQSAHMGEGYIYCLDQHQMHEFRIPRKY